MAEGFSIKNQNMPRYLYKYRDFSCNHKLALLENVLWMSPARDFNDIHDLEARFDANLFDLGIEHTNLSARSLEILINKCPEKIQKIMLALLENRQSVLNTKMLKGFNDFNRAYFGIMSLSEEPLSNLMWAHYSNSSCGFLIEYDFATLDENDMLRRLCFPVFYSGKPRNVTRYMQRSDRSDSNNLFGYFVCLTKNFEFDYEKEWRIVHALGADHAKKKLEMPKPSSIILGSRTTEEDANWMTEFCARNSIPLRRVQRSFGSYEINMEAVPKSGDS